MQRQQVEIKNFASNSSSVLKWCLNRPSQAENTNALKDLAGLRNKVYNYKPLRPSQILKSEERVSAVVRVLQDEYLNPFDLEVDATHLFNLSSGIHVQDDLAKEIVSIKEKGVKLSEHFKKRKIELYDKII